MPFYSFFTRCFATADPSSCLVGMTHSPAVIPNEVRDLHLRKRAGNGDKWRENHIG